MPFSQVHSLFSLVTDYINRWQYINLINLNIYSHAKETHLKLNLVDPHIYFLLEQLKPIRITCDGLTIKLSLIICSFTERY